MDDIDNLDEQLTGPIEHCYEYCHFCLGFYGPCFGEPVCATCHEFLYTEDFVNFQNIYLPSSSLTNEKDDGDSGNDEPSEEAASQPPPQLNLNAVAEDIVAVAEDIEEPPQVQGDVDVDEPIEELFEAEGVENNDVNIEAWDYVPAVPAEVMPEQVVLEQENRPRVDWKWQFQDFQIEQQQQQQLTERLSARLALLTQPREPYELAPSEDMSITVPPEIWVVIFKKLDDISLLLTSKVNTRFKQIITELITNSKWEEFTTSRWPLFKPIYEVDNWYSVYNNFLECTPCKQCFRDLNKELPEIDTNVRSLRSVRLNRELKWMRIDHPDGIEAVPLDKLYYNWLAKITGPPNSPYQGGVFYINLKIPHEYPLKPPSARMLTRIFHPNISRHGDIGIDCIQHNWTLALTIPQILLSVQSLLTDPNIDTYMEKTASELYINDRSTFDKIARVWTWKYAYLWFFST